MSSRRLIQIKKVNVKGMESITNIRKLEIQVHIVRESRVWTRVTRVMGNPGK